MSPNESDEGPPSKADNIHDYSIQNQVLQNVSSASELLSQMTSTGVNT